jgi:hypothetical protein
VLFNISALTAQVYAEKQKKNRGLPIAASLPLKAGAIFPGRYVPQLATVTAVQVRWSSKCWFHLGKHNDQAHTAEFTLP